MIEPRQFFHVAAAYFFLELEMHIYSIYDCNFRELKVRQAPIYLVLSWLTDLAQNEHALNLD